MIEAGKNLDLTESQACELAVATAAGAAKLISKTGQSPRGFTPCRHFKGRHNRGCNKFHAKK